MEESILDSNRFGIKVGKTDGVEFKTTSLDEFKKKGFRLLIARVSMEDIGLINLMEDIGFRVKDTQVTYKHDLLNHSYPEHLQSSAEVRQFKSSDTPHVVEIAKIAFKDYGHYFNDERLAKTKCLEVYADWTYNICTNSDFADIILIAAENDIPTGFLSLKKLQSEGRFYASAGLHAVNPLHWGKNIGSSLVAAGLDWAQRMNLQWCEHNVLVTNVPVNRVMIKAGFKPSKPVATMHCWLDI